MKTRTCVVRYVLTGILFVGLLAAGLAGIWQAIPALARWDGGAGTGPGGVGATDGTGALELWLMADAGVTTSGGSVSSWADQSGKSANVTQGTSANQPLHVYNQLNGQPIVRFDGLASPNGDFLNIPANVIQGKTAFSFFTVFRWNGVNAWQRLWDFGSSTTVNGFVTTRSSSGTPTNTPRFAITTSGSAGEQRLSFTNALPTGSGQLVEVIWGVPNGNGWRNGGAEASGSSYSLTPNNLGTITQHYIGKSIYTADPYLNGDMGEFIIFSSALNTAQRILVENYLSAKYAVALTANDVYDGDTPGNGDFDLDVAGIGRGSDGSNTEAHSAGMIIVNGTFLQDNGDYLLMGHKVATNGTTTADCPSGVTSRWTREWYLGKTDVVGTANGTVDIGFDFSESGLGGTPSGSYTLLKRTTAGSGTFSWVSTNSSISGDRVTFSGVDASLLGSGFTLGSGTPTAVTLARFEAAAQADGVLVTWETAIEIDTVGFNLYRSTSPDGFYAKLNEFLIPSQSPGSVFGAIYTWLDEDVQDGITYYYKLEDVEIGGQCTLHGPIAALSTSLTAVALRVLDAHGSTPGLLLLAALIAASGLVVTRWMRKRSIEAR